jgi:hypothetical protein
MLSSYTNKSVSGLAFAGHMQWSTVEMNSHPPNHTCSCGGSCLSHNRCIGRQWKVKTYDKPCPSWSYRDERHADKPRHYLVSDESRGWWKQRRWGGLTGLGSTPLHVAHN